MMSRLVACFPAHAEHMQDYCMYVPSEVIYENKYYETTLHTSVFGMIELSNCQFHFAKNV